MKQIIVYYVHSAELNPIGCQILLEESKKVFLNNLSKEVRDKIEVIVLPDTYTHIEVLTSIDFSQKMVKEQKLFK